MAHGSGLDGQIGFGTETTWGTRAVPTAFVPFSSESLTLTPTFTEDVPIRSGLMVQPVGMHQETSRTVEGSIEMELLDRGIGKLLNMLHGNTVTPTTPEGATDARQYVHEIGETSPFGKGLTIQVARPDISGTLRPFDYVGCKITEMVISIEAGGVATVSFNVDGRNELTDQSVASATYPDARNFVFNNWAIEFDDVEGVNVLSATITVPLNFKADRYALGQGGLKSEQLANAPSDITVAAELEFASLADHARFTAGTPVSLNAKATGSLIEGAIPYSFEIDIPCAKQVSSGPALAGHDVVVQSAEFQVKSDGQNAPLTITQVTSDSAL